MLKWLHIKQNMDFSIKTYRVGSVRLLEPNNFFFFGLNKYVLKFNICSAGGFSKSTQNEMLNIAFEPPRDKTSIYPVWSESSLSAWRKLGFLATHWAHSEDSDQTGWMPRLIWVFAGHTAILLVLSCRGSFVTVHTSTCLEKSILLNKGVNFFLVDLGKQCRLSRSDATESGIWTVCTVGIRFWNFFANHLKIFK